MFNRLCLVFILFITFPIIIHAQDNNSNLKVIDYSDHNEYTIADIKITGVQYLDKKILINMSGLNVGRKIQLPSDEVTKIVQKFWDQGLFSDVKVIADKIQHDSVWLEINLQERPRISKFEITGVKKSEVTDLNEKLKIKPGNYLNDNVLNNISNIIKNHYNDKGFLNTEVHFIQVEDTVSPNKVRLTVEVDKKNKVKIDHIEFLGNTHFDDKRLRRTLKKTKQKDWNIFTGSKFIETKFKEDKQKLVDFYKKNGYRDFKILSDSIQVMNDGNITLNIRVFEGNQYHIRSITWVGNTKYPSELLDRVLIMKKGDVYDQIALEKRLSSDEDAVSSLYLDHGYLFYNLNPVEVRLDNDSVDLEMQITEGKQATINKIIITGNTKTKEHVVRRELYTRPGDLFSKALIIRSVRMLSQLQYFNPEKIEPIPLPNPSDGTVDIQYKLEEKANDQLELSGGWGGYGIVGTIGISFNNFAARDMFKPKAWRPVPSGDGQKLSLRAQSNGSWYKAYSMTFMEPWLGGKKPNSLSVSLFYNVSNIRGTSLLQTSDQSFKTVFGRSTVDQPIYPRSGSSFTLGLQITPPYSLFKKKNFWLLSMSELNNLKAIYGSTDPPLTVDEFNKKISDIEQARQYKWIEYHKWTFKATWYNQLFKDFVLMFNAQFGYLGYFSKNLGYSPFEGFVLGGDGFSGYSLYGKETIGLRGYENESLSPLVNSSRVANVYQKITFELHYPITLEQSATIYALAFLEGGNSWYKLQDYNPFSIKRSAGVGIRAFLPMFGMLGIDWGYGFDQPYIKGAGGSNFHFVIGQQF